jgi:hypothetical protein
MDFEIARIDNNYMYVHEKREGLGTNLFLTQVHTALKHGFHKIHLTAMGPEDGLDWKGYYFWAILGFENTDIAEYRAWASEMGRAEPTLSGNFHLTRGHPCLNYLQNYLYRKNIDFTLYS